MAAHGAGMPGTVSAPGGARGRAFGPRSVHGFDLTFCAPKSVSLVRALRAEDDVLVKAITDAHSTAIAEAMILSVMSS